MVAPNRVQIELVLLIGRVGHPPRMKSKMGLSATAIISLQCA